MSSRSQDAATLAELAKQVHSLAAGNVKLVSVVEEINTSLASLTSQVNDLEEEVDRLNRG
jgi:hypothetical protein